MNIDDYESLPTTSVSVNMTAGAIAGILEHIVMYPMDSVKVCFVFPILIYLSQIFLFVPSFFFAIT